MARGNRQLRKKVTPSQQCKMAGLRSLAELVEATATSEQTLINWQRNKPKLFAVVVAAEALQSARIAADLAAGRVDYPTC